MPNHETNNVLVIGDPAQVAAFVEEAFTDGRIDFEKIVKTVPTKDLIPEKGRQTND